MHDQPLLGRSRGLGHCEGDLPLLPPGPAVPAGDPVQHVADRGLVSAAGPVEQHEVLCVFEGVPAHAEPVRHGVLAGVAHPRVHLPGEADPQRLTGDGAEVLAERGVRDVAVEGPLGRHARALRGLCAGDVAAGQGLGPWQDLERAQDAHRLPAHVRALFEAGVHDGPHGEVQVWIAGAVHVLRPRPHPRRGEALAGAAPLGGGGHDDVPERHRAIVRERGGDVGRVAEDVARAAVEVGRRHRGVEQAPAGRERHDRTGQPAALGGLRADPGGRVGDARLVRQHHLHDLAVQPGRHVVVRRRAPHQHDHLRFAPVPGAPVAGGPDADRVAVAGDLLHTCPQGVGEATEVRRSQLCDGAVLDIRARDRVGVGGHFGRLVVRPELVDEGGQHGAVGVGREADAEVAVPLLVELRHLCPSRGRARP